MKRWLLFMVPMLMLLALGPQVEAAAPVKAPATRVGQPAAFSIEGKILRTATGQFEVQVTRVERGAALKIGQALWIRETAKTKVRQGSKALTVNALKAGERVEVSGAIATAGKTTAYSAMTVQIVK